MKNSAKFFIRLTLERQFKASKDKPHQNQIQHTVRIHSNQLNLTQLNHAEIQLNFRSRTHRLIMNERIVNNNRPKSQSFLALSTNCTPPPIQRIGNQPLECRPPRPKRIQTPHHVTNLNFYQKEQALLFLYPPLLSSLLLAPQSPATLPRRPVQPTAAALPLPRTAQPTKESLCLVSAATGAPSTRRKMPARRPARRRCPRPRRCRGRRTSRCGRAGRACRRPGGPTACPCPTNA